jgi:protein gp37
MTKTKISWTQGDDGSQGETWNPTIGCEHESEGCRWCYAERQALRIKRMGNTLYDDVIELKGGKPHWTGVVKFVAERLSIPLAWTKPRKIFVDSMSDMFHEDITNEEIAAIFGVMAASGRHTFQLLTKRTARMPEWFAWLDAKVAQRAKERGRALDYDEHAMVCWEYACIARPDFERSDYNAKFITQAAEIEWPLVNAWIGTSVENQDTAEKRVPQLLRTPAVIRFLSCEPLLGLVELDLMRCEHCIDSGYGDGTEHITFADDGTPWCSEHDCECSAGHWLGVEGISWIIGGCESGPNARPCDVEWLRALRNACRNTGTAFWLKQAQGPERQERHQRSLLAPEHDASGGGISMGEFSRLKAGGLIEMPELDGVAHREFPDVSDLAA